MSDLNTWLNNLGLEKYAGLFEREEIDLTVLADLTEADLERIGLPLGPRKKLLRAVATMAFSRLAEEKAKLEAALAQREAEHTKREAEAAARQAAEARERADAEARREAEIAKREAEAEARAAAEDKARLEAIAQAKRDTAAELARREAEYQRLEAQATARADAETKARREVEERASQEAAVRARAEAEERFRREAEEKLRREAEARTRAEVEARGRQEAEERARREAALARRELELQRKLSEAPNAKAPVVPVIITIAVLGALAFGVHYWEDSRDQEHLAELNAAVDAATRASQELDLARQRQEELIKRVEVARLAEQDARAKGDQAKLRELQEQTRKAEAEALKQAEQVRRREVAAKQAEDASRAAEANQRADAAKGAAEKAVADKLAADKSAAAKAAAKKTAAERPGWPAAGDRWIYVALEPNHPENTRQAVVEVQAVTASSVQDVFASSGLAPVALTHQSDARLSGVAPGIYVFSPYLRAFQELHVGDRWSDIVFQNVGGCGGLFDCTASARIVGKEHVSVRAGSYEAWKIVIDLRVKHMTAPSTATGEITYWYAEEAKQIVKYRHRIHSVMWVEPSMDMELVSYTRAGAR